MDWTKAAKRNCRLVPYLKEKEEIVATQIIIVKMMIHRVFIDG
ncbi:MAG: hypothetical protein WD491_13115 [Balneolales bacterium]